MAADSKVVTHLSQGTPSEPNERPIGAVLVEAGRLSARDVERIVARQAKTGQRFGEAGIKLGLLTRADIDFALARQFDYDYLLRGQSAVSQEVVAAYEPIHPLVERMRDVRNQLMVRWFDGDPARRSLAVLSAARREGRSFMAANLAVLFSQFGRRTLLIDADLRNPVQHRLFAVDNRSGLSAILAGRGRVESIQRIPGLRRLSVLPAGVVPPNPPELVARPALGQLLRQLADQVDVIVIDSPAASESTDAQMIAVRAGAAMIVVRRNTSRVWRVRGVSDDVVEAKATVVGTVLNDF